MLLTHFKGHSLDTFDRHIFVSKFYSAILPCTTTLNHLK